MGITPDKKSIIMIYAIVNRDAGSKVLYIAKSCGLTGGTVFLGRGTINNNLLKALALNDTKKDVVLLIAEESIGTEFLNKLSTELNLHKRNQGIAFIMNLNYVCGSKCHNCCSAKNDRDEEITMYQSVYIIIDKGKGEMAVDAATTAGAKGATIIIARGSGIHETSKLFNMDIEPEKEIVMIILKSEITDQVVASIRNELDIDKPGNGIIFVQNVRQIYGLYE